MELASPTPQGAPARSPGRPSNREAWLAEVAELLRPRFADHGLALPNPVAVTCGWPSHRATARRNRVTGQCWAAEASSLKRPEIFISPIVEAGAEAAHILLHELIHAAIFDAGHGAAFKRAAVALGLEGKMTATVPSARLTEEFAVLLEPLGPYPHGAIDPAQSGRKKQGTRLRKVGCPACGYVVRTTAKWLEVGVPTCPCGTEMEAEP